MCTGLIQFNCWVNHEWFNAHLFSGSFWLRSNICSSMFASEIHHFPNFPSEIRSFPVMFPIFRKFTCFSMFFLVKKTPFSRYLPLPGIFPAKIQQEIQVKMVKFRGKDQPWRYVFALMPTMTLQPDVVSFSAAISSCEKMGQWQQAHGVNHREALPEKSG